MDEPTAAPRHGRLWMFLAAVALAVVTGAMFYKVLAPGGPVVLSSPACDLSGEFLSARQFGFSQLAHGNLALWNPHIYGGVPFFGNFQSALLYPPNWIFMALPTEAAVNWSIAAHVLLLGLGMLAWARWRGISVAGGLLGALVVMFGGAHFLHIYAGHLSNLCTMAWAPLLLAAVDGCLDRRRLPWALMGSMVVAMMVLAGHPQYVFFSGIVAAIYALARLWHRLLACVRRPQPKNRPHKVSGPQAESLCHQEQLRSLGHVLGLLSIVALGGLALAAVQLLAGLAAASSSVRTGGLRQDVAGMFSLPPENLLMLIAPWFYGVPGAPYWGKWYPWEMTLFIGAAGGLLAAAGIARGRLAGRRAATVTLGITLLLAMGSYTPLFELIYRLPLFNMLRGLSKFIFQASLFLGLFAGAGLDAVVGSRRRWNLLAAAAAAVALAVLAGAAWIRFDAAAGDMGGWRHFMSNLQTKTVGKLVQVYLDPKFYHSPEFLRDSSAQATRSLLFGAGALAVGAALLMLTRWWRLAGYCIALLAVGEVLYFASAERPTFTPGLAPMLKALTTQAARPIDYRILNEFNRNQAMETEFDDVWGSGPDIRQRWAEYFCVATGRPLERVSQYADFRKWDCRQMFAAARLKYVMLQGPQNQIASFQILNPLGRLELVPQWRIVSGREAVLAVLADPAFDPRRTVILETPLPLTGEGGPQGRVRVR